MVKWIEEGVTPNQLVLSGEETAKDAALRFLSLAGGIQLQGKGDRPLGAIVTAAQAALRN